MSRGNLRKPLNRLRGVQRTAHHTLYDYATRLTSRTLLWAAEQGFTSAIDNIRLLMDFHRQQSVSSFSQAAIGACSQRVGEGKGEGLACSLLLLTATDSPVREACSALRVAVNSLAMRISAGTLSPTCSSTMSPGSSSLAGKDAICTGIKLSTRAWQHCGSSGIAFRKHMAAADSNTAISDRGERCAICLEGRLP